MCSHNVHANSGRVDLNCRPKWSILGSASLRNIRQKTKCFFTCIIQLFNGFHFLFWIDNFLYVLSLHWKSLIFMNIVFKWDWITCSKYGNYFKFCSQHNWEGGGETHLTTYLAYYIFLMCMSIKCVIWVKMIHLLKCFFSDV